MCAMGRAVWCCAWARCACAVRAVVEARAMNADERARVSGLRGARAERVSRVRASEPAGVARAQEVVAAAKPDCVAMRADTRELCSAARARGARAEWRMRMREAPPTVRTADPELTRPTLEGRRTRQDTLSTPRAPGAQAKARAAKRGARKPRPREARRERPGRKSRTGRTGSVPGPTPRDGPGAGGNRRGGTGEADGPGRPVPNPRTAGVGSARRRTPDRRPQATEPTEPNVSRGMDSACFMP